MSKYAANLQLYPLYTLFSIKIFFKNYFFQNPGTIGTNQKSIIYQWLFAQICTKTPWYNEVQLVQKYQKARNCNSIGGRVHEFCFLFFNMLKGVHHENTKKI